ncbi:MAG: 3-dehydroquinate synthase [Labilithrix sp.]|nr:3-dehydroquinate synthase [Labilithrix sp.]
MSPIRLARPLVLSGFMGTGKSTIGRILAARLGVPFVDTDQRLEEVTGRAIPLLFHEEGEARFREREAELVLSLLDDPEPRVIALGGGTVTVPRVRHRALEAAFVVTLRADAETIVRRVATAGGRPNLAAGSPLTRASDLLALRREAYGECHAEVSTEGLSPEQVAEVVLERAAVDALAVPLGTRSYAVELGDDIPERLAVILRELRPSSLVVVTDSNVHAARSAWTARAFEALEGLRTRTVVVAPGEPSKKLETVGRIWDEALGAGLDRDAVVVAIGGGVIGDLAGFAASTLLRGVRCLQVPTTLLAMVDSSVGGKTGFDHAAGKNLIGAFFQPTRVLVDLEHLTTLPARERVAGLAEVAKIALVLDAPLLDLLERDAERLREGDRAALAPVVRAAIEAKIRVVRDDEREAGARALLNVGHTVGHALESHGHYERLLHGEAVAVGTVLELEASERLGLSPAGVAERARALLARLGLPTAASADDVAAAWPFVLADKKRAASGVKLPVITGAGTGRVVRVDLDALRDALLPASAGISP